MPWDDFDRVGSPARPERETRGLSLGRDLFPPALEAALARAGLRAEEAADREDLASAFLDRRHDFLICKSAALGTAAEAFMDTLLQARPAISCPVFLVREERMLAEKAPVTTQFSEIMGAGQDALGYFIMIRATLRRNRPHVLTEVLTFGELSLDQEKFTLSFGDTVEPLKMLEFCLLGAMMDAPRMVWNKVFLNRVVFGPAGLKPGRQFDTYMSMVRRGIRGKIGVDPIVAEHGIGYALSPAALGAPAIADMPEAWVPAPRPQP